MALQDPVTYPRSHRESASSRTVFLGAGVIRKARASARLQAWPRSCLDWLCPSHSLPLLWALPVSCLPLSTAGTLWATSHPGLQPTLSLPAQAYLWLLALHRMAYIWLAWGPPRNPGADSQSRCSQGVLGAGHTSSCPWAAGVGRSWSNTTTRSSGP